MNAKTRWALVTLFAVAMAWVESAVVVYLRTLIGRIDPYQSNPLPVSVGLGDIELVREAATLIMLLIVGLLAGRTWRSRLGYAMAAFGIWDLCYYAFLIPMSGWPHSLLDWDILFLLPLPWWGPVLAPMLIATLMVGFGALISQFDDPNQPLWPHALSWGTSLAGALMALYTFMADSIRAAGSGLETIRITLPTSFPWPLFIIALALMAVPLIDIVAQLRARRLTRMLSCE